MCQHLFGLIRGVDLVQFYRMTGRAETDEQPLFDALYSTS